MPSPMDLVTQVLRPILTDQVGSTIVTALNGLLDGAEEDIRTFGLQIGANMVVAITQRDLDWREELQGQVWTLLELNSIRVRNQRHAVVMQIMDALINMALRVAIGVASEQLANFGDLGGAETLLDKLRSK